LSRSIRITPLAEADIERAQDDYETREQGLGNRFVLQVRATLDRIAANPSNIRSSPARATRGAPVWRTSRSACGIASNRTRASLSRVSRIAPIRRWRSDARCGGWSRCDTNPILMPPRSRLD
jgi:hypothetical protein